MTQQGHFFKQSETVVDFVSAVWVFTFSVVHNSFNGLLVKCSFSHDLTSLQLIMITTDKTSNQMHEGLQSNTYLISDLGLVDSCAGQLYTHVVFPDLHA